MARVAGAEAVHALGARCRLRFAAQRKDKVGRVGADLDADAAKDAAFWCGMNILATLREVVGFENVVQVHKLVGFVNCVDGFEAQPTVINGCSDLLYEVLGDKGRHARSAVGVNVLPLGVPVEIEAVVEVQ